MAMSNALDESESDAQGDHSRAVRLLRGTRYKCATGWRLLERILFLLCDKSRRLLNHRRFLWQVVLAALRSRGAKFIPSLEGRGFLWQFCNDYSMWKWTSTLPERGVVEEKEEHGGEERGGAPIGCER